LEIGNNVDCIVVYRSTDVRTVQRVWKYVYMNEYVWKWQIRKRSRNMAIVCTIEMDDQTDLRKLGSWEISG